MDLKLSHTFVQVHDQDQALAFYRDGTGHRPTVPGHGLTARNR
ncbi:hypothetical protein [Planomonospora sp. ID91781]|nr:hypothetical protein [Planomonospora sp. ID91781]